MGRADFSPKGRPLGPKSKHTCSPYKGKGKKRRKKNDKERREDLDQERRERKNNRRTECLVRLE